MTVSGNWTLHFSWGGTGAYAQTGLTFNSDHSFSGSYTGKWRQQNGTLMLAFDGGPAKYGGTVNGNIGSGVMSTFSGLDGNWYLSKQGTTGILPESAIEEGSESVAGPDGSVSELDAAVTFPATVVGNGGKLARSGGQRSRATAKAGAGKGRSSR